MGRIDKAESFASLRESNAFYVNKTDFIRIWWEAQDDITLITRPRRFGKALNMKMQGTWPVIFLSFADVKQWYDGFTFGTQRDIYNPWSITNFLKEKQLRPYWEDTSSNGSLD